MLCQVRCLVLRISVPSRTLCCSVYLTNKRLELELEERLDVVGCSPVHRSEEIFSLYPKCSLKEVEQYHYHWVSKADKVVCHQHKN